MNTLRIESRYLDLILQRRKKTTIRLGRREIIANEKIFLEDEYGRRVSVNVGKIILKRKVDLNLADALVDGFQTVDELVLNLERIYPESSATDLFTIIEFDVASPSGDTKA